jgi:hypothetical protein
MLEKNLANNLRRLSRYRAQGTRGGSVERAHFLSLLLPLTAVCRPSLWRTPGMLITAPAVPGAGSGKGLLVRVICMIAFGVRPARSPQAASDRNSIFRGRLRAPRQGKINTFVESTDRTAHISIFGQLERATAQHVRRKIFYGESNGFRRPYKSSVFETFMSETRARGGKQPCLHTVVECAHRSYPIRLDCNCPCRRTHSQPLGGTTHKDDGRP